MGAPPLRREVDTGLVLPGRSQLLRGPTRALACRTRRQASRRFPLMVGSPGSHAGKRPRPPRRRCRAPTRARAPPDRWCPGWARARLPIWPPSVPTPSRGVCRPSSRARTSVFMVVAWSRTSNRLRRAAGGDALPARRKKLDRRRQRGWPRSIELENTAHFRAPSASPSRAEGRRGVVAIFHHPAGVRSGTFAAYDAVPVAWLHGAPDAAIAEFPTTTEPAHSPDRARVTGRPAGKHPALSGGLVDVA